MEILWAAGRLLLPILPSSVHHLYVVAEGSLLSVPWSALRIPCSVTTCYVVERFATSIEPSASIAVSLAHTTQPSSAQNVLIVADTVSTQPQASPQWMHLTALPSTRREADTIAHLVPATHVVQLRGKQATVDNVRSALQTNLAVLHVATHTLLVSGHPELSGIALSSGNTQSVLWLRDIPFLHAPPIVTLSGCTTQGTSPSGEETLHSHASLLLCGSAASHRQPVGRGRRCHGHTHGRLLRPSLQRQAHYRRSSPPGATLHAAQPRGRARLGSLRRQRRAATGWEITYGGTIPRSAT